MKIQSCGKTDTGLFRQTNEDSILVCDDGIVYAVADGLGGHNAGEIASGVTVETIEKVFGKEDTEKYITNLYEEEIEKQFLKLVTAFRLSNRRVFKSAIAEIDKRGMGTTLAGICFSDGRAGFCNVGDSRIYLLRDGELRRLTRDDSLAEKLAEQNVVGVKRNIITLAVGMEDRMSVTLKTIGLQDNDLFLVCSDGLTSAVDDDKIKDRISQSGSLESITNNLIETAKQSGSRDNISVIVVKTADVPAKNEPDKEYEFKKEAEDVEFEDRIITALFSVQNADEEKSTGEVKIGRRKRLFLFTSILLILAIAFFLYWRFF